MNQELDQNLCETFPILYQNRRGDPRVTLMCWGFECGDGWYNILYQLSRQIQGHLDWNNRRRETLLLNNPYNIPIPDQIPQVTVTQVKQKYGTLRFYYDGGDELIRGMVTMAEAMTAVTCETCGAPGRIRGNHWFYTACDDHTHPDDLPDQEDE